MPDEDEKLREKMKQRYEIEETLEMMEYNEDVFIETQKQLSKMLMSRYLSLQDAGFTQSEAFDIVLKRGLG